MKAPPDSGGAFSYAVISLWIWHFTPFAYAYPMWRFDGGVPQRGCCRRIMRMGAGCRRS